MYSKIICFNRYIRKRIDHWYIVEPGNPNPRAHRSSGKLGEASFPTGTVDPRVGISLSPLDTNETWRYIKLDRSERLCDKCSAGAVEDEQHFLIECSKFNEYRNNLQTVNCTNKISQN